MMRGSNADTTIPMLVRRGDQPTPEPAQPRSSRGAAGFICGSATMTLALTLVGYLSGVLPDGKIVACVVALVAAACLAVLTVFAVLTLTGRRHAHIVGQLERLAANQSDIDERLRQLQDYTSTMYLALSGRLDRLPDRMDAYAEGRATDALADANLSAFMATGTDGPERLMSESATVTFLHPR